MRNFAIFAIEHDFPNAIKLIIDKELLKYINFPILNMATSLGRNPIVKLLIPHIQLDAQSTVSHVLSQSELNKLAPKSEVNNVVINDAKMGITIVAKGYTSVHEAARVGNTEALVAMYMQNRKVFDVYSSDGFKPIHVAMRFNQFMTAKIILKFNSSIID